LVLVLASAAIACRAGATVYAYRDEAGALHLSDVPDDARYRPLAGSVKAALAPSPSSAKPKPYAALINDAAQAYGIDAALVHAVISVESGYNARALSKRGAAGLMQLMAPTAARYGVSDI